MTIPHTEKPMLLLLETYRSGQRVAPSLLTPHVAGCPHFYALNNVTYTGKIYEI